jgi:class 3 adenylate cyclase
VRPRLLPFSGIGAYLTADLHSVRASSGFSTPDKLIDMLKLLLDHELRIVEAEGGTIEQFVGDAVIAYWLPSNTGKLALAVSRVATRLVREKIPIPDLTYRLRVQFAIGELAGAYFGPAHAQRFQVIGKARERAKAVSSFTPGKDCILTDAATFLLLPDTARAAFSAVNESVYVQEIA